MRELSPSELTIGVTGLAVLAGFAFWRLLLWIKNSPVHPNPWDDATEEGMQQPDALPVCHHCLTQVPPGQWFCETCGCAVGPYNNWMPYLQWFSVGEVLRNASTARMRPNFLTLGGYALMTCWNLVTLPLFLLTRPTDFEVIYMFLSITVLLIFWRLLFKNFFDRAPGGGPPDAEISESGSAS